MNMALVDIQEVLFRNYVVQYIFDLRELISSRRLVAIGSRRMQTRELRSVLSAPKFERSQARELSEPRCSRMSPRRPCPKAPLVIPAAPDAPMIGCGSVVTGFMHPTLIKPPRVQEKPAVVETSSRNGMTGADADDRSSPSFP
jgi:hypothetical protein